MVQIMLNTNHWLIQGIKYEHTFFFLKQKNRGYIQKRPTIYRPIQKRKCVYKCVVKPEPSPLLWRRAITQHSVSWRWIGTSVYTETSSHFCMCRIIQIFPTELAVLWLSSFSIFPTRLHELQLLMSRLQQQFLRSQHDRRSRISLWETNWPPTESITMNKSFLSFFQFCTVSHFKTIILIRLVPSQV